VRLEHRGAAASRHKLVRAVSRSVVVALPVGTPAHTAYYDQGHLQQMLMENVLNLQAHTRIVTPCCRLNRCDDNGTDVCEFVLHLWGLQPKRREEIFSLIIEGKKPDIGIEMPRFNVASE
jgi:hypothetical protein